MLEWERLWCGQRKAERGVGEMWDNKVGSGSHGTGMLVSGEARTNEDGGMEVPGASV